MFKAVQKKKKKKRKEKLTKNKERFFIGFC